MRLLPSLAPLTLAVGLLLPAPLAAQDEDRGFAQGLIEDALSDTGRTVRITGFEGALSASAQLERLTVADADGVWLVMEDAQLDWRRAALLRGRLEVEELSAARLTLLRLPTPVTEDEAPGFSLPALPPPEASPFALPDLPVAIRVGEVRIDAVELGAAVLGDRAILRLEGGAILENGEGEVSLSFDRIDSRAGQIDIAGSFSNATEILDLSLVLDEPAGGIAATVLGVPDRPALDLSIAGLGPISDFTADLRLASGGEDRLSGQVTLRRESAQDGEGEAVGGTRRFAAQLSGDPSPLLAPEYRAFLGSELAIALSGARVAEGGLTLDQLEITSRSLNLSGALALGVDGWPMRATLDGRIAAPEGGPVLLSLPGPKTEIGSAALNFGFDAAAGDRWTFDLQADGVQQTGFAMEALQLRAEGRLQAGTATGPGRVEGDLRLDLAGLDLGDPALTRAVGDRLSGALSFAAGEGVPIQLRALDLGGSDYRLQGHLDVSRPEDSSPRIDADLILTAADLRRFAEVAGQSLTGAARVELAGFARPLDGAFDLALSGEAQDFGLGISQLDPLIAGAAKLSLRAARDGMGTRVEDLILETDQTRIAGDASVRTGESAGALELRVRETALVHPEMGGPVAASIRFDQVGPVWNADLSVEAPGGLAATGTLRTPERQPDASELSLTLRAADLAPYRWMAQRPLSGAVDLTVAAQGDLAAQTGAVQMTGGLADLSLGSAELDALLAGDVALTLAAERNADLSLRIAQLLVDAAQFRVDARGTLAEGQSDARFTLGLPELAVLVPDLRGALSAEGRVQNYGSGWDITSQVTGPGGLQADIAGLVDETFESGDLNVAGAAPLALANRVLVPNIAEGLLRFDLALSGPFTLESLAGVAETTGARLSLPEQRLALDDVTARARVAAGSVQLDVGAALSSGGRVTVTGPVSLSAPFAGDLDVALQQIVLQQPGLLEASANGALRVQGPLTGGAQIAGRIDLIEVAAQVPDHAGASSVALPGLIHRNEPGAVRATRARAGLVERGEGGVGGPPFGLDILLSAPARIFVRGRGLDAELGGEMRIGGTTAAIEPAGQFELIRGRLNILGKRLVLSEATFQPQGDLDAYMRVVASSSSSDIEVQFVIEGPVSAPELQMTSSPELPDDEILAQFLFGRSLSSVSGLQALQIASALATLSGRGGGALGRARSGIGLDDLDVTTDASGAASVRAGTYLSDNVYSDINRTSEGETEINLNLTLTPSLTARGTVSSDSSTSIGVFFENDY